MDDKDFIIFKTLYEEKNMTHAARRLFISQPTLSERIKKLEQEFGSTLIIRQPRGILFTPAGEDLYAYFTKSLKDYERIKDQFSKQRNNVRGTLRIACSNIFAMYRLPKILSSFKKMYPDVDIHLSAGQSHDLYRAFLEGKFEIAIVRGERKWPEQKLLIWEEQLCGFSRFDIDLKRLPELPYIHYSMDVTLQDMMDEWWFSYYSSPPNRIMEVGAIATAMKLVDEGLGYTLISESCNLDTPNVKPFLLYTPTGEPIKRNTWMYYRNNYQELGSLKAFVDYITEYLEQN